jgi:hypothetical protein
MSVSPVNSRNLAALFAAVLLMAAPVQAWAQSLPETGPGPSGAPVRLTPPPVEGVAPAPAPAQPALPFPNLPVRVLPGDGVQIDALSSVDPDSAGALTAGNGGFGAALWEGTDRALVDVLLPRLPVNSASSVMRDLMRRLLLSAAVAPQGSAGSGDLVALRVRLLADMGDFSGVNALLDATPARNQNVRMMRVESDSRLLANDIARACALATAQIQKQDNPYWQKAFIFCQALAGEHDKAALGVALLSEAGEDDQIFFTLVDALASGQAVVLESLPNPSPLHLAMARAAKVQLPADVISSDRPGVLRTIAISPNAPVELRLEAAERAEASGALPVDALRQLYSSITFSDEDLANPLTKAEAESGPLSRALLYRTSIIQTVPTAQAEAVARALALAREGGRYASTVRAFMPVLKRIMPSTELMWFAPEAVRALMIGGLPEAAENWLGLLRASALFNTESGAVLGALMPVARLALSTDTWSPDMLGVWWEGEKSRDGARKRAALLYTLFESLGEPVPQTLWEALFDGPDRTTVAMPHPALWYGLAKASSARDGAGRVGETILLSLLAIGEGGPGAADPVILRRVLTSLGAIGLEKEARSLAVEAALSAGL